MYGAITQTMLESSLSFCVISHLLPYSKRSYGALTSNFSHNERTSTGSSMPHRQLSEEKTSTSKIPLLPAVVAPQFVPSQPPQPSHPSQFYHQRSRQSGVRSSSSRFPQPPSSNNLVTTSVTSTLAVVNEDLENSSSDKTLTNSHGEKMVWQISIVVNYLYMIYIYTTT